jgi:hypothetical protein
MSGWPTAGQYDGQWESAATTEAGPGGLIEDRHGVEHSHGVSGELGLCQQLGGDPIAAHDVPPVDCSFAARMGRYLGSRHRRAGELERAVLTEFGERILSFALALCLALPHRAQLIVG